jgi:hypothetical protein
MACSNSKLFIISSVEIGNSQPVKHVLVSVTYINQLMHSIITVIDVKISLYKSLEDTH